MSIQQKLTKPPLCDGFTHEGAVGKRNEDSYDFFRIGPDDPYIWDARPADSIYVATVADGVTSKAAGANASFIAVETVRNTMRAFSPSMPIDEQLAQAFHAAHHAVTEVAAQQPEFEGMSSTLVVAAIQNGLLHVAHLGDSRAYLIRDGVVYRLTLDHSGVQLAMDNGVITEAQAKAHPNRHMILRHLAAKPFRPVDQTIVRPGTGGKSGERRMDSTLRLHHGDTILLCSDGVSERVLENEMSRAVARFRGQPKKIAKCLVTQALKHGEPDNITAVVMSLPSKWSWLKPKPPARYLSQNFYAALLWGIVFGSLSLLVFAWPQLISLVISTETSPLDWFMQITNSFLAAMGA